jgi:hypothetical protein
MPRFQFFSDMGSEGREELLRSGLFAGRGDAAGAWLSGACWRSVFVAVLMLDVLRVHRILRCRIDRRQYGRHRAGCPRTRVGRGATTALLTAWR